MAAVLACGEGAVLSHSSAGELWASSARAGVDIQRPADALRIDRPFMSRFAESEGARDIAASPFTDPRP
jgi:hypothetical protein